MMTPGAFSIGKYTIHPVATKRGKYWKTIYEVLQGGKFLNQFGTLARAKGFITRHSKQKANPAIPSQWTPVSITRKGKQIQIRTRGR